MSRQEYLLLGFFGLAIIVGVSSFQSSPGYMDADYYMAGGITLAKGSGFNDYFLWNYLDNPKGLPHPSNAYWMPLSSLVSALGIAITGDDNFSSARMFFLLIASMIAPLSACLSFSLFRRRDFALLAGIFGLIPGYYLVYLGTTDTFAISMVLGSTWLLVVGNAGIDNQWKYAILGFLSGLLHLSRADGIIWILIGFATIFSKINKLNSPIKTINIKNSVISIGALVGGYLLVMGPWMLRNLTVFGTLLSPGGLRTLWLIRYDDLYAYPGDMITFDRWLASGINNIIAVRWHALLNNIQTAFAVQGSIFLTPLVIAGLWKARQHNSVKIGGLFWLVTMIIMTAIFPQVGWRGGFFHSGAAVQPLFWAVAPAGLAEFVYLGIRFRDWSWRQAWTVFCFGGVILLITLTLLLANQRLNIFSNSTNSWNHSLLVYSEIEADLEKIGASDSEIVLVNNPPGYYIATNRSAISIPDGNINSTLAAAERYGGKYLILEPNHPIGLENIYRNREVNEKLVHLFTLQNTHIYRIKIAE